MPAIRTTASVALAILAFSIGMRPAMAAPAAAAAATNPLDALSFLIGSWEAGDNTGAHGTGMGATKFETSLQGRVIVRTNHAEYPATGDRPALKHDDLMVIYAAGDGALEADYYDNEGHKIHYTISASDPAHVVFLGDAHAGAPLFRLTYAKRDDKIVDGQFDMAVAGHPDTFQKYLAWEMHRAGGASRP